MSTDIKKAPLGRGLSALLGEASAPESTLPANTSLLPTLNLKPGKFQPRHRFDDEKLTALIDSIREKGIIQPLIVRPLNVEAGDEEAGDGRSGTYEIIAGERRWRAARTLNLETVPVVVRACDDREALETALVENIQRDDLTPLEEAEGYLRLQQEFGYTQEDLARSLGKSRSHIANILRLNQLPDPIKNMVQEGKITAGHARMLVNADNVEEMAQRIVENNLNVRQAEQMKREGKRQGASSQRTGLELPETELVQQTGIIEAEIAKLLNLRVSLKIKKTGATLTAHFKSYEEIDEFMDRIRPLYRDYQ